MKVYIVKTIEGNQGVFQSRRSAEKELRETLKQGARRCHMFDVKCDVILLYNNEVNTEARLSDIPMNAVPNLMLEDVEEVSVRARGDSGRWDTMAIETWELEQ